MAFRHALAGFLFTLALMIFPVVRARADDTATQDVQIVVADTGTFAVILAAGDDSEPDFGEVGLDAITNQTLTGNFRLEYTDTLTDRSAGSVSISVGSFEPVAPVPPFLGSDQALFQIPNRYLTLQSVGGVVPAEEGREDIGAISAVKSDEGQTFDDGNVLTVASVAQGRGVGSAIQPIVLSLTVPAGVYPTTYAAAVTVETTVAANGE